MKTFKLERGTIQKIAKRCNVTHSAVSQWFSDLSKPSLKHVFILEDEFGIPARAWLDIKSYLNDTSSVSNTSNTLKKEKV